MGSSSAARGTGAAADSPVVDSSPFDALARDYDQAFSGTLLGQTLRELTRKRLQSRFPAGASLLELGCGTGDDAIWLANRGHRIVAIDASREMLSIARAKARMAGCADRIDFHHIDMNRLGDGLSGAIFDGAFSNFGAINCAADLSSLSATIANVTRPGAAVVFVVMGRFVPWEWAWFLARLNPEKAFRRLRPSGSVWRGLRIRYPTPAHLARILSPRFEAMQCFPLGCLLPPSYAAAWLEDSPRAFAVLARLECALSGTRWLAAFSDHYIVDVTRSEGGPV